MRKLEHRETYAVMLCRSSVREREGEAKRRKLPKKERKNISQN